MKILQVITSLYMGGAERLLLDMVPRYISHGIQVDILLFDGTDTPLKEQLSQKGVRIYCLAKGQSVYSPSFIKKLVPYLKRYDIIHTHLTACQYFVALACVLYQIDVPLVTTEHSTRNRRRNIPMFFYLERWMYHRYKRIITISKETEIALRQHLKQSIPFQTINNGIDLKRFKDASPLNEKISNFIICMVAAFREEKNQDTVIKAMALLPKDCYLWLVGDGPRKPLCEDLAKNINVSDRVKFLGIRSDVPSLLKSADIVVLSSHWEGFGLAAAEGMAAGKPVIASNVSGLSQVVGDAGLLFNPSDEHDLASKILSLKEDKSLLIDTAMKCSQRANDFDINVTVSKYIQVYQSVLNSSKNILSV